MHINYDDVTLLGGDYVAKDSTVYFRGSVILNADLDTFKHYKSGIYSCDKNSLYYGEDPTYDSELYQDCIAEGNLLKEYEVSLE